MSLSHHFEMDSQGPETPHDEPDNTLNGDTLSSTLSNTASSYSNRVIATEKNVHSGGYPTLPAVHSRPPTTDYAEITSLDRTMQEVAFHKMQNEIESQMQRLQNLNTKEFLAEMDVIRQNLNLTERQMMGLTLMTLREVPIKHRHCNCCHIVIRQKYTNCLFTAPASNPHSAISLRIDRDDDLSSTLNGDEDSVQHTPPSPSPMHGQNGRKYPRLTSLKSLFNSNLSPDTPTSATTPMTPSELRSGKLAKFRPLSMFNDSPQLGATTDVDSILESQEMEYQLLAPLPSASPLILGQVGHHGIDRFTETTITGNTPTGHLESSGFRLRQQNGESFMATKMHIDLDPEYRSLSNRQTLFLCISYKIRGLILFVIPLVHTAVSAVIALAILVEIASESFDSNNVHCALCRKMHEIFYGPKVHDILTGTLCFEMKEWIGFNPLHPLSTMHLHSTTLFLTVFIHSDSLWMNAFQIEQRCDFIYSL